MFLSCWFYSCIDYMRGLNMIINSAAFILLSNLHIIICFCCSYWLFLCVLLFVQTCACLRQIRIKSKSINQFPWILTLSGENSRSPMSPASAFAIATAAAGHSSSQGRQSYRGTQLARWNGFPGSVFSSLPRLQFYWENLRQGVHHPAGGHQQSPECVATLGLQALAGESAAAVPDCRPEDSDSGLFGHEVTGLLSTMKEPMSVYWQRLARNPTCMSIFLHVYGHMYRHTFVSLCGYMHI